MSVDITQGGLEWEASIDTSTLEDDMKRVEAILKGAGVDFIDPEANQKAFDEVQKRADDFIKNVLRLGGTAQEQLQQLTDQMAAAGITAQHEITDETKKEIQNRIDASKKEIEELAKLQQALVLGGGSGDVVQTKGLPVSPTQQKTPMGNALGDALGKDFQNIITQAENAYNGLDDDTKAYIDELVELQAQMNKVEAAQKALNKANAEGNISADEYVNTSAVLAAQQRQVSESIDLITKRQKDYDALNNASVTSINEKKAALSQLKQTYVDLTEAERKSASGQSMAAEIAELKTDIANLNPENVEKAKQSLKGAYQELSQLKNQLASGGLSGEQLQVASDRAVELQGQINAVNKQLKLSASNTAGIDALGQALSGLVAGYTAFAGATGLLNANSEESEDIIANVTSAMGVLNGVQEIAAILTKDSSLNEYLRLQIQKLRIVATEEQAVATVGLTAAEGAEVVATEAATVATTGLNAAMFANPAGILLLALTAVIAAIQIFGDNTQKATEKQIRMNDALSEANNLYASLVELYNKPYSDRTQAAQEALSLAQAQGKSEAEIYDLRQKATELARQENVFALYNLDLEGTSIEEKGKSLHLLQTELEVRTETELSLLRIKAITGKLTSDQEQQLELVQSQKKVLESTVNPAQTYLDNIRKAEQENDEQRAAEQQRQQEAALKSTVAYWQAKVEAAQKGSDEERKASLGLNAAQYRQTTSDPNITAGELSKAATDRAKADYEAEKKFNQARIDDSKNLANAQLAKVKEGSLAEFQYKKLLIELEAEQQIVQSDDNNAKITAAVAEREKAIAELIKKYRLDILRVELEGEIANTNTLLSESRKGSEEELQLKKQLVDQKAQLEDISAQASIKNEQLLASKVKEIYSKSLVDKKALDDAYNAAKLKSDLDTLDNNQRIFDAYYDRVINDPKASRSQVNDAIIKQLQSRINTWQSDISRIKKEIASGSGDEATLRNKVLELDGKIADANGKINQLGAKAAIDQLKKIGDITRGVASAFHALSQALQGTDDDLAATLDTLGTFTDIASDAIASAASFASGDIGPGIASAANAIAGVFSLGAKARESERQAREQIEKFNQGILEGEIDINIQYRERQRIQEQINKAKLQGLKDEQKQLEKNQQQSYDDYQRIFDLLQKESFVAGEHEEKSGGIFGIGAKTKVVQDLEGLAGLNFDQIEKLFMSGQLTDKAEELFKTLQKLKEEGADIDQQLIDLQKQAQEIYTGTTSDNILDGIVDGFKNGLRSAADFADNFQDLMTNAVLSSLKYKTLEPALEDFYKAFSDASQSGDVLTKDEINQLQSIYDQIISDAQKQFDNLTAITGLNMSKSAGGSGSSLSGAVKGITEQQADLLAGQFGGLRLTALDQLNIATQSLHVLYDIRDNTARLVNIERIMRDNQVNGIKIK